MLDRYRPDSNCASRAQCATKCARIALISDRRFSRFSFDGFCRLALRGFSSPPRLPFRFRASLSFVADNVQQPAPRNLVNGPTTLLATVSSWLVRKAQLAQALKNPAR